jgi:gliding motility-associated-like protein
VNNCQNTATATVTVNALPAVNISPPLSSGCAPLCVNFSNIGNNSPFSAFSWNFGNGTTSPNPAPQSCYASAGTFTASLTVTDSNGCKNSSNAVVNVYPVPVASFGAGPQPTTILDPSIQFYNYSSGAIITGTDWYFGDGDSSSVSSPLHAYTDTGMYYVQLTVTSNYGCTATTTQPVYISPEYLIYVPNAFTPNGDNTNDVFMPRGEGITEYTLYIFDRWGQQVFKSENIFEGWDGKKGDVYYQEDVYVWKIEVRNHKGEPKRLAGIVSLIK